MTPSAVLKILCVLCVLCVGCFSLDRDAFTFVNYDLHARVTPPTHGFAADGKLTLRNDSQTSQKNVTLQISSALDWNSIRVNGQDVLFQSQPYQSDADHTGVVNEAVITLPTTVAPKQTLEVEVSYGGQITADSTRLTRIGTPEKIALGNDWDRITNDFTAVRGVGYVCWYPVSMEPANLSEGNRYFDVVGGWKQRNANATMKLTLEAAGDGGIVTNGRLVTATAHMALNPEQPATRENVYIFSPVGEYAPTFAVANFETLDRPAVTISYLPDHKGAADEFALDTEHILPFLTDWYGPAREKVRVIELAEPNAQPFDSGALVFTPLKTSDNRRVEVQMAHQIAHACLPARISRAWIGEGLAQFAQALVREHQDGRKQALAWMNAYIPALASAEEQSLAPASKTITGSQPPEQRRGQSLITATDPAYYSIKATFVWWMLRDMIGDQALGKAIRAYDPARDKEPATMQRLVEAQAKRDLEWFFDDWVYRDRSLPDFRVETAFVRPLLPTGEKADKDTATSVTLTIENLREAGAEVPLVVRAGKDDITVRVLVKGKSKAVQRVQTPAQPTTATVNDGSVPEANITNNVYTFSKLE